MLKRKWRVLIVDDEFRIGMLIKKLIRWDEHNMECLDVVDNGETAFQIVQEAQPEVVITDIRMPKISGLDLISMTREKNIPVKFVVISGYKEFEYAHRALQYGVDDYLLKPINEEELNKVLRKIAGDLASAEQQSQERKALQDTVSESRQIIKRDFLKNIIEQEDEEEIEVEDSRVTLEGAVYRGIDIKLDYVDYNKNDKKQDRLTVDKVIASVERILKAEAEEVLICEKENLHIYCLFNYDYSKSKAIKNNINDILSEIQEILIGFEQYVVTIGVGTERTEFGEIRFSIKEAYRAVGNRIKLGTGRLIYADSIVRMNKNEFENPLEANRESVIASIESYSREQMEQCINQIYSGFMLRDDMDFSKCYELAEQLVSLFAGYIDKDEFRQEKKRLLGNCQHCYTIPGLKNLLKSSLGSYLDMSREAIEAESTKPVRQAEQYIEEHYNEKIVLEDIADIVGLNSVYFSVLFKKETGINFSNYLLNVRMEKAKEMICNTNETIAAIGEMVGYKDSRYFSQIFTKTVGVKPALYRKLHS